MENVKFDEGRKWCTFPGIRYLFVVNGFLGFCVMYAIRININVAIIAMVNGTAVYNKDNQSLSDECKDVTSLLPLSSNTSAENPQEGEFIWSPKLQGAILGAFYYGYFIPQIPGGRLAEIFSGKWVFGIGVFVPVILTLLTPLAARYHVGVLIAIRALEGLFQGVTLPAMHSMLGRWMPDSERGLLVTIIYSGITWGTVVFTLLSAALCNSDWFGGWPSAFYVSGIMGCCWFLLWCVLVSDTPQTHPCISQKELKYIISNQKIQQNEKLPPIPWKKIFASVPFWAIIITQTGSDWCYFMISNDLPTYFSTILHFDIQKSGFMTALPHLNNFVVSVISATIGDFLIRRNITSVKFVRKVWNSVSGFGFVLGMLGVILSGCNTGKNVAFFTFALAIGGFVSCGCMQSHLDLSPEYAGTIMGAANTISNLTGFLAPLLVGALTEKYQTLHQWHIVFGFTCAVSALTSFIFILFSSTEKQDWANHQETHKELFKKKEYGTIPN